MKIFKFGLLVAALSLATQGYSFDLGRMALNEAFKHAPQYAKAKHSNSTGEAPEASSMPASIGNFGACQATFVNGTPPVVPHAAERKARALCFDGFAVLHSGTSKSPIYSAEVLNKQRILDAKGEERTNIFFADARLPSSERAELSDFKSSGLDRGHLSPAGDAANPTSMAQTFSLANMMPQAPILNRKAWAGVESATRKYALRAEGNVYVITGSLSIPGSCPTAFPAINQRDCTIGRGVVVPSHIYKLVYDVKKNKAWAHWTENNDDARTGPPISYSELVKRTGIDFFPGVHPL